VLQLQAQLKEMAISSETKLRDKNREIRQVRIKEVTPLQGKYDGLDSELNSIKLQVNRHLEGFQAKKD